MKKAKVVTLASVETSIIATTDPQTKAGELLTVAALSDGTTHVTTGNENERTTRRIAASEPSRLFANTHTLAWGGHLYLIRSGDWEPIRAKSNPARYR